MTSSTVRAFPRSSSFVLEQIYSVPLGVTESFGPSENFIEGKTKDGVSIYKLDEYFKDLFLCKKEEGGNPSSVVTILNMQAAAPDIQIRGELEDSSEITLAQLWQLLVLQKAGRPDILRVDGCGNIAYIRDVHGELWTIFLKICTDGWHISTCTYDDPRNWDPGNFVLASSRHAHIRTQF